ncbi:hypothetical protein [Acidovorax sp. NCPPB 3576]|uniref:hypothetical protein n=1 Tax=Acidovorax sp. NCPPB 3576 TaxID=2940488 RepID=UPI00234BFD27|nr:hypothetical protein [Acidovorax sp. NCPPB 3576]WCM86714.1 hypothetical protein M5C98_15160 [Acidovorax sp. NCPPB 3576]
MPHSCAYPTLHRVALEARPPADSDIVVLPLRLFHTDVLEGRRSLHRLLGQRLQGYRIDVDAARHCILIEMNVRRGELAACLRLLTAGMPCAEFGRVAKPSHWMH